MDNIPSEQQKHPTCDEGRDKGASDADELVADYPSGGGDDTVDEGRAAHNIGQIGGRESSGVG